MPKLWKKARGKLGFLEPLLGQWVADAETPMGPYAARAVFRSSAARTFN